MTFLLYHRKKYVCISNIKIETDYGTGFSVNNIILCIATYLMMVVKLVYTRGLVEIVKDKLANL